jgi:hypothetical protein
VFKDVIKLMLEEKCMMKSIRLKLMAIALVVAVTVATSITVPFIGNVAVAEAATVKISESKLNMEIAATTTLKVTGTKSKVTWKTSNKTVATVTSKGVVTAQSAGTAKITATVSKKNYTCTVTVVPGINPYQTSANFQEIQMAGLSFVAPNIYEVSGDEVAEGSYKAVLKLPDSLSSITVIANVTGTEAVSYEDVMASFEGLSEENLQASFDATYGAGNTAVSDLSAFAYESQNGTTSFAYSFLLTTEKATARMISYNLSIDDYSIEVISRDVEGYDIYIDAEYLIDSLMYVQ